MRLYIIYIYSILYVYILYELELQLLYNCGYNNNVMYVVIWTCSMYTYIKYKYCRWPQATIATSYNTEIINLQL